MLKDQENKSKFIVTDHDTTLMSSVANAFHTYALLCSYHITKNVRSRLKHVVGTKQIYGEYGKMVKCNVILERIMDV